jgi:hypothetical protein
MNMIICKNILPQFNQLKNNNNNAQGITHLQIVQTLENSKMQTKDGQTIILTKSNYRIEVSYAF